MPLKHTHAHPHTDHPRPPPALRPQVGVCVDPTHLQTHLVGTHGHTPAIDHSDHGAQAQTRVRPHTLGHTQALFSATDRARASARTRRSTLLWAHPKPGAHYAHARPRVPAPSGSRPSGAGRSGGGSAAPPGKLREAGRPPLHPPTSLPPTSPSEPSRAGAKPRAPTARAERGTESWRTRPASTVREDGGRAGGRGSVLAAAPPCWLSAPVSSPAPAWGSFLFSFAAAGRLGWAHLGGMRTYCA